MEVERPRSAIGEVERAGWSDGVELSVFEGPNEYLYGEETAMLETLDGRHPFPRIAPPYPTRCSWSGGVAADLDTDSGLSAHVEMAGPGDDTDAPPTLVDNVETLANVALIVARGGGNGSATEGTSESPGTIVCTVTGSTAAAASGKS